MKKLVLPTILIIVSAIVLVILKVDVTISAASISGFIIIFGYWFTIDQRQQEERWVLKRDACIKSLKLGNAILSNYKYPNVKETEIEPQYIENIAEARAIYDELACTCDKPEVLNQLKIIIKGEVTPAAIVDLRNAVRKELGFSKNIIDKDIESAFLGKLNCSKSAK